MHLRTPLRVRSAAVAPLAIALLAGYTGGPASAAATSDVKATVNGAIAKFNRGDMTGLAAACDSPSAIIDEFAPYVWLGKTACADWGRAFVAYGKANAITEPSVVLGSPWHVEVTGDRAYVVAPSSFLYKLNGKATKETGAYFAFTLKKTAQRWLIEAWSWSTNVKS